ncbi:hypothetical protein FISHEDRAFT_52703, partial [Fistulina hepatica ATCC 64428]
EPDTHQDMEFVRHLSKYVFPRQYGLESPFTSNRNPLPDYADREAEIQKLGRCKTPKRLKGVLELLEKMIWRHGKCAYLPLRDKVCPSKVSGPRLVKSLPPPTRLGSARGTVVPG